MQPDKASAVMAAMIDNRKTRATRTGPIPHNETAPVLHLGWLINRVYRVPDALQRSPRCCAEPGPMAARTRCTMGPGSAAHHAAKRRRAALRPGHVQALTPAPIGQDTPVPPNPQ